MALLKDANWCLMAVSKVMLLETFCGGFLPSTQNCTVHILDGWWELHLRLSTLNVTMQCKLIWKWYKIEWPDKKDT